MGRVCMVRDLVAEFVLARVCYEQSLSWAEFVMGRDVPESSRDMYTKPHIKPKARFQYKGFISNFIQIRSLDSDLALEISNRS